MTATKTWTCWRDANHKVEAQAPFGWPQCTECGAGPGYHERVKFLPRDLTLTLFVPTTANVVAARSAVVGYPKGRTTKSGSGRWIAPGRTFTYYEGWLYGQHAQLNARQKWEAGVKNAADRMVTQYPTSACGSFPDADLVAVGTYSPITGVIEVTDEEALNQWLT